MKKVLLVLLFLAFAATTATAQFASSIGMYSDDMATSCDLVLPVYVTTPVYFFANMDPLEMLATIGVEFKVDNLPGPSAAMATPVWDTPLVIGAMDTDIALAFNPALEGPLGYLGLVNFFGLADLGADYVMTILAGDLKDDIIIVNADGAAEMPAGGGQFTFNCSGTCVCSTAVEDGSWSSIKALY